MSVVKNYKRITAIVLFIAVTICSILPTGLEARAAEVTESNPMYRLYNPNSGEHFYTADEGEKDYLSEIGWNYEGIGWNAPVSSNSPVYRLYNPYSSDHHYTMDEGERDYLSQTGWNYEGIGWYSDDAKSVPLYRQFNPNEVIGTHNYTKSLEENNWLCSTGWQAEGIGWYGVYSSEDEEGNEPLVESEKSVDAYSVTDIKLDKNSWTVSANVGAPGNCKLVVRFVEEDTYFADDYVAGQSYINNGNTLASCDVKAADEIKGVSADVVNASALPAYYVIEAVLVDTNGKQLCSPYTSSDNTARHEEFESKDVDDFEGKNVLNFDDDTTTNFGVLNDEVKTVTATTVFEEIEEVGESHIKHYTIDSPSEDINVGDKVYLTDNQGEYLFKIASMNTLSDGRLYVTAARADDATMGFCIKDFYEYLDVEMESEEAESEDKYSDRKNDSVEGSKTFPYNRSFEFDGMEITNSGDATIYFKIDIEFSGEVLGDHYLKCDYVNTIESDYTLSAKVKVSGEKTSDKKKIDKKIPLVKGKMPLPVPVFDAFIDLELKIEFEASIGLTVTGNTYNKSGFNYNSIDGYQKIAEKNTQWKPSSIEAEATIKAGINAGVGVEFLGGVISVGLDAFLGVVINVKISATAGTPDHLCNLCLEGSVNAAVEVSINLKYNLDPFEFGLWEFEGTIIGIDLYDGEYPLFDFYVSLASPQNSYFHGKVHYGKGKCPNKYVDDAEKIDIEVNYVTVKSSVINQSTGNPVFVGKYPVFTVKTKGYEKLQNQLNMLSNENKAKVESYMLSEEQKYAGIDTSNYPYDHSYNYYIEIYRSDNNILSFSDGSIYNTLYNGSPLGGDEMKYTYYNINSKTVEDITSDAFITDIDKASDAIVKEFFLKYPDLRLISESELKKLIMREYNDGTLKYIMYNDFVEFVFEEDITLGRYSVEVPYDEL